MTSSVNNGGSKIPQNKKSSAHNKSPIPKIISFDPNKKDSDNDSVSSLGPKSVHLSLENGVDTSYERQRSISLGEEPVVKPDPDRSHRRVKSDNNPIEYAEKFIEDFNRNPEEYKKNMNNRKDPYRSEDDSK